MEVNHMPKYGSQLLECEEEIAPFADDLKLVMKVLISEDEKGEVPATRIVYGDEEYYIHVFWLLKGKLARHFCGKWQVKVDLESIGTSDEFTSDLKTVDMDPCKEGWYRVKFTIGPDDLNPHPGGTVYLPAVTLSTLDACGDAGHMWGYCVGPNVMFTEATPHED
jgi:hypothetical protein